MFAQRIAYKPSLSGPFGLLDKDFFRDEYRFEAYYSAALTP